MATCSQKVGGLEGASRTPTRTAALKQDLGLHTPLVPYSDTVYTMALHKCREPLCSTQANEPSQ